MTSQTLQGVIDVDTIRLLQPSALPVGTTVRVIVIEEASLQGPSSRPGEGLQRAFGAWSDYGEELDRFVEDSRQLRRMERREPGE